jgi:hypothetical protein
VRHMIDGDTGKICVPPEWLGERRTNP